MKTRIPVAALVVAGPALALLGGRIQWEATFDGALERAAQEKKVVFIAVNMDGERANDRMAEKVYRDQDVVVLTEWTVNLVASTFVHAKGARACPRFGGLSCDEHRRVDIQVREEVLEPSEDGYVVAPQHVFLAPDRSVLLSVPYQISAEELQWCLVTALQEADPSFDGKMPAKARPPRRLILGGVFDGKELGLEDRPPTREEVLELLDQIKRGALRGGERMQAMRRIMTADEPEAIEFIRTELRRGTGRRPSAGGRGGGGGGGETEDPDERRARLIRLMGVVSPPTYWDIAAEYATASSAVVRAEVPVALEQLGAPESLKAIRAARKKEKDPAIEKNWLRALGAAGAEDKKARKTLLGEATSEKDGLLRANAIVALGSLAPSPEVDQALTELLSNGAGSDRAAAALAMGWSRRPDFKEGLQAIVDDPELTDEELKAACQAAAGVLESGDLTGLRQPLRDVAGDRIDRRRFFGREPREGERGG